VQRGYVPQEPSTNANGGTDVEDADAVDTSEWVFGFLRSFLSATLSLVELVTPPQREDILQMLDDPRVRCLMEGQIALMAAIEAVKSAAPKERVIELVEIAFLRLYPVHRPRR
jgi:hypothetical protein